LTTLINSILNNGFVTMSDNSKLSDKKWSYPLWLPEPHPPAKFSKECFMSLRSSTENENEGEMR